MEMNEGKLRAIARNVGRPYEEVLEFWEERVAIRELDGGMSRRTAESDAYFDVALELGRKR
jgi:hypothetical protein